MRAAAVSTLSLALGAASLSACAATPPPPPPPPPAPLPAAQVPPATVAPVDPQTLHLRSIASQVSQEHLHELVAKLVSFGTRHTLSSQTDPNRGIGAALDWTESEFERYSAACGGCLDVRRASQTFTGRRIPNPTEITNVFAVQRGTERPNDVVIITGHIDSRVSDVMDFTSDAPGANDDGSGVAAVIEAARVLSRYKFPGTIVYAPLTGEEQGLYGGKIMADYAKAQGWNVIANLNNDIIGNSCGSDGVCDPDHVRVFSEGPRSQGQAALADATHALGGENDAPSRNLSRYLDSLADRLDIGLDVRQIWRTDRFGRGGDHIEFLEAGYPAVRLTVAVEDYEHQHQDLRVENGIKYGDTIDEMDFPYLEKVTELNVAALAAIASAPPPPEPRVEGAVQTLTTVAWPPVPAAASYIVRWRRTDANQWQHSMAVPANQTLTIVCETESACMAPPGDYVFQKLPHIRVDDWVFGVSSVGANGYESPVAAAVPGGAFEPYVESEEGQ